MSKTILVPLDGSPLAERALDCAAALARATGGPLILLRATEVDSTSGNGKDGPYGYLEARARGLWKQGIKATPRVVYIHYWQEAAEAIRSAARDESVAAIVMSTHGRGGLGRERRIARAIRIHRRMGSAALAFAYVANGRFDAFVQNGGLSHWDVAAAGLIAQRAGATVTDLHGGPWWNTQRRGATISIVAAPPPHHAALLELLAAAGTQIRTRRP